MYELKCESVLYNVASIDLSHFAAHDHALKDFGYLLLPEALSTHILSTQQSIHVDKCLTLRLI